MKHKGTAFCYLSPNAICVYCFLQINSIEQMSTDLIIIEKEIKSSPSSTEVLQHIFFQQKLIMNCES